MGAEDRRRGHGKEAPEKPARELLDKDGLWDRAHFYIDQYPVLDLRRTEAPRDLTVCEQEERGGRLWHEVGGCLRQHLGVTAIVRPRPECVG